MVLVPQNRPAGVSPLIQEAVRQRRISRRDHLALTSALLSDPTIHASDRSQISHLLDAIRQGKITLVD